MRNQLVRRLAACAAMLTAICAGVAPANAAAPFPADLTASAYTGDGLAATEAGPALKAPTRVYLAQRAEPEPPPGPSGPLLGLPVSPPEPPSPPPGPSGPLLGLPVSPPGPPEPPGPPFGLPPGPPFGLPPGPPPASP